MTTPSTTTTTSTTSTLSSGISTLQQSSSIGSSQVVGNYATTATVQPYVATQVIGFHATNMRPGRRVHVFFDGVNVDQYSAPAVRVQDASWLKNATNRTGNWGAAIYVDNAGNVCGQFNVPEGKFKTGVNSLEVADIDDLTNDTKILSATTVAAATFTSGALPVARSIDTPTTITAENGAQAFQNSLIDPTKTLELTRLGTITETGGAFLAQSFTIPENLGTPGVYIDSIDLFFRKKPAIISTNTSAPQVLVNGTLQYPVIEYGVGFYLCEVNNGYPDETTILPLSIVKYPTYFNNYDPNTKQNVYPPIYYPINATSTGGGWNDPSGTPYWYKNDVMTRIWFDGPQYCVAGKTYAIVIKPDNYDQHWQLWSIMPGQSDSTSGVKHISNPQWVGSVYYGFNGRTDFPTGNTQRWTEVKNSSLKFNVNIREFNTTEGYAYFTEKSRDYLTLYNIVLPNSTTLGGILPGDIVYLANSSFTNATSANVVGSNGSTRLHWGVVDHYDPERQILYVDTSDMNNGSFWYNTDVLWPSPSLNTRFRTTGTFPSNSFVQIHRSSNNNNLYNLTGGTSYNTQSGENLASPPYPSQVYTLNGQINNSTIVAYANTGMNYNPKVNSVVPQFSIMTPPGTSVSISYTGTYFDAFGNTQTDASNTDIRVLDEETNLLDYERVVLSRSTANIDFLDKKTATFRVKMTSDNPYLSPMVDIIRSEVLAIRNFVDPISSTYQEFFNTGSSRSKYISQIVTLAEGQDAEDLQVILSAYRPPSADIQVWVKFLNGNDSEPFSSKTWTPLKNNNVNLFCDAGNEEDFKDFTFTVPYSYPLIPTTGGVTCNSSCTAIVGTNTLFQSEVGVGWYINMAANSTNNEFSRKIVAIASNTNLTIDSAFTSDYSNTAYFIVPPPTTAWLGQNTYNIVDGLVTTSTTNNAIIGYSTTFTANTTIINNTNDCITLTNANTYFNPGNKIYYQVPAGNTAIGGLTGNTWYYVKFSNTTTVSLTDTANGSLINITGATTNPGETHTFVSTNFTFWYQPGDIINVNGDSQVVVSVANDTYLTVGSTWTSNNTNQPAYLLTSAGLTYETSSGAIFTSYKKFQIKIVLQSNDTSKVPVLNNLRALSLQL